MIRFTLFFMLLLLTLPSCTSSRKDSVAAVAPSSQWKPLQTGKASYYGGRWHRRLTANGERYDQHSMTAAHKTLPFNTRVKVTNLHNGKTCEVRINNRGPFIKGRVIDLSVAAAKQIGAISAGVVPVKLEVKL
jgi:rare lipoprotein A